MTPAGPESTRKPLTAEQLQAEYAAQRLACPVFPLPTFEELRQQSVGPVPRMSQPGPATQAASEAEHG